MKKFVKLIGILAFVVCCLTGCEKAADKQPVNVPQLPQPPEVVEVANLQPGESVEITVIPELREYYFSLGRLEGWFYLPEFDEGKQSNYPLDYWYLLLLAEVTGWDEYGYFEWNSVWGEVPEVSQYGSAGSAMISQAEFDAWVQAHFGDVELQHQIDTGKYYDFDGEYYYGWAGGSIPLMYYELAELSAENVDGRIIYTAVLYDDYLNEYNFFWPDAELTLEQNRAALAEKMADAEPGERAVYEAFGEESSSGEMSMDEAIRQTSISGNTQDFPHYTKLQVKYYLNEETGEPFYLAVHWLTADNEV